MIYYFKKRPSFDGNTKGFRQSLGLLRSRQNYLFLILGIISFAHFIWVNSFLSWAQAGDPWWLSRYVMAILNQSRFPTTLAPYDTEVIQYPLGFLLPVAGICATFDIVPGISLVTVASFIFALIVLIPPYFTYQKTESIGYSLLSFALCFYMHPSRWAENCIYYDFLNGTYPVMMGILQVFMVLTIIQFKSCDGVRWSKLTLLALLTASIFVTYPSFIFVPGIAFFLSIVSNASEKGIGRYRNVGFVVLVIVALGVLLMCIFWSSIQQDLFLILRRLDEVVSNDYRIRSDYFTGSIFLPITIIAIIGAILEISDNDYKLISILFLVLTFASVLSLNESMYHLGLGLLLPNRLMLFLQLWSFSFVFVVVHRVRKRYERNGPIQLSIRFGQKILKAKMPPVKSLVRMISSVFIPLLIVIPIGFSIVVAVSQTDFAWYTRGAQFQRDLQGMEFIRENYGEDGLILNYQTWSDWALPSAGLPNVVYTYPTSNASRDRALALAEVWEHPDNESQVRSLVEKYEIGFVFVSSFWGILPLINGWNYTTIARPIPALVYIELFMNYDFLEIVYRQDDCAVFRVLLA